MNYFKTKRLKSPNFNRECIVIDTDGIEEKCYYLAVSRQVVLAYEPETGNLYKFQNDFSRFEKMSIYNFLRAFKLSDDIEMFNEFKLKKFPFTNSELVTIQNTIMSSYSEPSNVNNIDDICEMFSIYSDDGKIQFEELIVSFLFTFENKFNFEEFLKVKNVNTRIKGFSYYNFVGRRHSLDDYFKRFTEIICGSVRFTAFAVDSVYESKEVVSKSEEVVSKSEEVVICQGCGCEIDEEYVSEHEIFGILCPDCNFEAVKCSCSTPKPYGLGDKMYNQGCLTLGFELETNCNDYSIGYVSSDIELYSDLIACCCEDSSLRDRNFEIVSNYFTISELESDNFKSEIIEIFNELHAGGYNLPGSTSGPAGMHVHVNRDNPYIKGYSDETLYTAFSEVYNYLLPHYVTRLYSVYADGFTGVNTRYNFVNFTNSKTIEFRHFHAPRSVDEFYFNLDIVLTVLRAVNIYLNVGIEAVQAAFTPNSLEYSFLAPSIHSTSQEV